MNTVLVLGIIILVIIGIPILRSAKRKLASNIRQLLSL